MSPSRAALKSSPAKFAIRRLRRSELPSDTVMLARFLVGKVVVHDLTRGPGRLAAAFQIDRRHDGLDLCASGSLWLGETSHPIGPIGKTVRIGITRAADQLLRFYERGNPFVSGPKRFLLPATPRKKSSFGPN